MSIEHPLCGLCESLANLAFKKTSAKTSKKTLKRKGRNEAAMDAKARW